MYTGYGAKTLPGVREAMEMNRFDEANREARNLTAALANYRARIDEASRLLKGM
jgi:N-acetylated-alpha-linked acidic dipeptidase